MKKRGLLVIFCFHFLFISSCGKDKLSGDFEKLKGKYIWTSAGIYKDAWTHKELTPNNTGYSAEIEFDEKGQIIFYKDGIIITTEKYKTLKKESPDGAIIIQLKTKGDISKTWNVEQKFTVTLSQDSLLSVDHFPFPAIDNANLYFSEYKSGTNSFSKK